MKVQPDDRILLLSLPSMEEARDIVDQLTTGLLVGMANDEELGRFRKEFAPFSLVMIHPLEIGYIPWKERFFTVAYDPQRLWGDYASEVERVLVRDMRDAAGDATLDGADGDCGRADSAMG
jgi:hypothetical protein